MLCHESKWFADLTLAHISQVLFSYPSYLIILRYTLYVSKYCTVVLLQSMGMIMLPIVLGNVG